MDGSLVVPAGGLGREAPAAALRLAAFDVDDTLIAGQLGGSLPRRLRDGGLVSDERWTMLRDYLTALPAAGLEDPDSARMAYQLYASMLGGVSTASVDAVVRQVWARKRHSLFSFVGPLLADLHADGFTVMLISGGPEDLVALAAAELGVELYRGLRLEAVDGVYTGKLSPFAGAPKHELAEVLAGGKQIDWSQSLAAGDSLADANLLQRVGHPFAFEPTRSLGVRAQADGWQIADRGTFASMVRARLAIGPSRQPDAGDQARAGHVREDNLPEALRTAQGRLTSHLIEHIDSTGVIGGDCESRVVESAMMLTLLRRERLQPAAQHALCAYLGREAADASVFDATLIDALLRAVRVSDPDLVIERTLRGTDHARLGRKHVSLSAVLAVVDAAPLSRHLPVGAFEPRLEVPWTRLLMRAVKVIYLSESGSAEGPELEELIVLLESGQRRGVYERHLHVHLMALLALNRARPAHPLIGQGVKLLIAEQRPDGGMPFIGSCDIFTTATGGLALAGVGADAGILRSVGDLLAHHQAADGGWPFARDVVQADTDDTSYSVRALAAIDPARYRAEIARGRDHLRALAGRDGGFPTYLPRQPSEPMMTAGAMLALAPCTDSDVPLLTAAAGFLVGAQCADGTFGRSWSLAETGGICASVAALDAVRDSMPIHLKGRISATIDAALHRLLDTAGDDGGWGQTPSQRSDPISTAYAVHALARSSHARSPQVCAAREYLLAEQHADGGFTSPPDQAGPRPLRFTIPVLADIFVLLAMTQMYGEVRPPQRLGTTTDGRRPIGADHTP